MSKKQREDISALKLHEEKVDQMMRQREEEHRKKKEEEETTTVNFELSRFGRRVMREEQEMKQKEIEKMQDRREMLHSLKE